jgi:hypothetical protein
MYWRPQTGFKIYREIAGFLAVLRLVAHLASVVGSERKTELRSVGTSPPVVMFIAFQPLDNN